MFDHMFMSAGEVLTHLLEHYDLVEVDGPNVRLRQGIAETAAMIGADRLGDRVSLVDLIDCVLCYAGQYLEAPTAFNPRAALNFEENLARALRAAGLLTNGKKAAPVLIPFLIDHWMVVPRNRSVSLKRRWEARLNGLPDPADQMSTAYHPDAESVISAIADRVLQTFGEEFRSAIEGGNGQISTLPWSITSRSRFGERMPAKKMWIAPSNLALNFEVTRRLLSRFSGTTHLH